MNIVILGCGRVGSTLARQLASDGHQVTIIDRNSDAFRRLGSKYKGQKVIGTGLDQDTLRKGGIEAADAFVAVTQGDNTNIMAAQIAQSVFKVKKVLTRLYDPIRAEAYRDMGIETICTTTLVSGLFHSALTDDQSDSDWRSYLEALDKRMREHND
jgi:trk system potassium uptake protein TrkA